jgi:SAM-dependent methyltransferase
VDESCRASAEAMRLRIAGEHRDPADFLATLLRVPAADRDVWIDTVLGLDELPDDGPELPRGCVPYIPCPVDALLRIVQHAPVRASDVFVDLGSGVGRAAVLVHLLTGAKAIGIEIQSALVVAARALAARVSASHVDCLHGDAVTLLRSVSSGSVFFLYCPFTGDRLSQVLAQLEELARTKTIRNCCVDLPLPPCPWLSIEGEPAGDLVIYRSQ